MKFLRPSIFLLFILPLSIFLTFNKHSKDKAHSYHGVIWADAAGYYIHLPVWFIYGNDASALPANVSENCGDGFYADSTTNKIVTKYPCGTAILEAPFFVAAHVLARPMGYEPDGFSKIYSFGLYFAGIFYCCMGMFFLSKFLQKHFSDDLSVCAVLLLYITTNLYYYAIDSPAMSHVYSFFLFSIFIYSVQQLLTSTKRIYFLMFASSFVLAVLTRPTNAVILLFPFFYEDMRFVSRLKILFKEKFSVFLAFLLSVGLVIPQLIYWKRTFGSAIAYSYGNESFSNLKHPMLLETWFSPNNGLFIYAPVLALSLIGIVIMIKQRNRMGYFLAFLFLLMSYLFASWWSWWFGCSLGARSFVEFYVFLSIPLAVCIQQAWKNKAARFTMIGFIGFCCFLYFNIEYYYDGCFYGGTWDWKAYLKLLEM